jgi:hypothetical protein
MLLKFLGAVHHFSRIVVIPKLVRDRWEEDWTSSVYHRRDLNVESVDESVVAHRREELLSLAESSASSGIRTHLFLGFSCSSNSIPQGHYKTFLLQLYSKNN